MKNTLFIILLTGFLALALASCTKARFDTEVEATKYYDRGIIALNKHEFESSIQNFRQSIKLDPSNADAHYWLAVSMREQGLDFKRTINEFKKTLELDPTHEAAYRDLGILYALAKRYDVGFKYLKKAIELNPSDTLALINLGYLYYLGKDYDKAKELYEKAKNIKPNIIQLWNNYGLLNFTIGDLNKAEECFKKSISLQANQLEPYEYLAKIEKKRGNQEKVKYYENLVKEYKK